MKWGSSSCLERYPCAFELVMDHLFDMCRGPVTSGLRIGVLVSKSETYMSLPPLSSNKGAVRGPYLGFDVLDPVL